MSNNKPMGSMPAPPAARIILGTASFLLAILSAAQVFGEPGGDGQWTLTVTALLAAWLSVYVPTALIAARTPYTIMNAFLMVLILYHFGITVPDALGGFAGITWGDSDLAPWLEMAAWLSLLALACIGLGCSLAWGATLPPEQIQTTPRLIQREARKSFRWAGTGLLLAALVFFMLAIGSYGNILAYERVDLFRSQQDSRGWGAFMMVFPSAVTLLVLGAESRFNYIISGVLALLALAFFMAVGYRSAALFPLLVGIVLWRKTGRQIPTPIAIVVFAFVVVAIPAAGYWRSQTAYENLDTALVGQAFEETQASETLLQGQTAGVLANVLRLVPEQDPYRWGTTYLRAAWHAIPNVLPQTREDRRGTVKTKVLKDDALWRLNPGSWITYRLAPAKFNRGEGLGFSGIGEPYFNFGIAGVVVYFIFLGFALSRLDTLHFYLHPRLSIICFATLWPLFRTVRNDFANFLKPFGFILVILAIWWALTRVFPAFRAGNVLAAKRHLIHKANASNQNHIHSQQPSTQELNGE